MIKAKLVLNQNVVIQEFELDIKNWLDIQLKINERSLLILQDSDPKYDDVRLIIKREENNNEK